MEIHHVHILLIFLTFLLSIVVLVIGVEYAVMARPDLKMPASQPWIALIVYATMIPSISILGTIAQIFGLQLGFFSTKPTFTIEAVVAIVVACIQLAGWLIMSSVWSACELNVLQVRDMLVNGQPSVFVKLSAPAFCPDWNMLDEGYSLSGTVSVLKNILAWILFAASLGMVVCAVRSYIRMSTPEVVKISFQEDTIQTTEVFVGKAGPQYRYYETRT